MESYILELLSKTYEERVAFLDVLSKRVNNKEIGELDYGIYRKAFGIICTYKWNDYNMAYNSNKNLNVFSDDELVEFQALIESHIKEEKELQEYANEDGSIIIESKRKMESLNKLLKDVEEEIEARKAIVGLLSHYRDHTFYPEYGFFEEPRQSIDFSKIEKGHKK